MAKRIEENEVASLISLFAELSDARVERRCKHRLLDILIISICAVLCGAQSCTEFEDFGYSKEAWLRKFLNLSSGIPSHDTFMRVLSIVDPSEMERIFSQWVQAILGEKKSSAVSLDGKSVHGTAGAGFNSKLKALHLVNAYCHDFNLSLAQNESIGGSGGESKAALDVLDMLDIKDTLVMADAAFAVHSVVEKVRAKKGHYLVALKNNQRFYLEQVEALFDKSKNKPSLASTEEKAHGRSELRKCSLLAANPAQLDTKFFEQWPDLKTLIKIERVRETSDNRYSVPSKDTDGKIVYSKNDNQGGTKASSEIVYYLSSKKLSATEALSKIRMHWGIENGLHWVLDVAFCEDDWPVRAKRLARNLSSIRKVGLNLIRATQSKTSIRRQMKMAGWNEEALEKLVFGSHFDA